MMIYKIHQPRVITIAILLALMVIILILHRSPQRCLQLSFNSPQKCVQVSVLSLKVRPHPPVKRTRAVQGLDESAASSNSESSYVISLTKSRFFSNAWFRIKLVSSSQKDDDAEKDADDEYGDELEADEDYSETNNNYDEDELYDDIPSNEVFGVGDFDYNDTVKYGSGFVESDFGVISRMFDAYVNSSKNSLSRNTTKIKSSQILSRNYRNYRKSLRYRWRNITLVNIEGVPIVEDGIFWSDELEKRTAKGASDEEAQSVLKKLRSLNVQRVEPPTWNRCGRPKNQFVVFEDGSKACARYRAPHQYLVQGETLSFYLSRLLAIHNVPAVALSSVGPDFQGMWSRESVKSDLKAAKWEVNTTVAVIQWIENLERDKMPRILLKALENKEVLSARSPGILKLPVEKLIELLQWSDLIVFDYITGNYDRVASMQDAAEKERKPSILQETVHNLVRSKSSGGLWLIDNESGLLDSYLLLYGSAGKDGRFVNFHRRMLRTMCLFRRSTVERVRWLHDSGRAGQILTDVTRRMEPLFSPIKREKEIAKRLQQRIAEVYEHVESCFSSLS